MTFRQSNFIFILKILRDIVLFIIIIGFIQLVKDVFDHLGNSLTLTEDGVRFDRGLVNTTSREVLYENINIIETNQGLWAKIFNFGDIVINTGGDKPEIIFKQVNNPQYLRTCLISFQNN